MDALAFHDMSIYSGIIGSCSRLMYGISTLTVKHCKAAETKAEHYVNTQAGYNSVPSMTARDINVVIEGHQKLLIWIGLYC